MTGHDVINHLITDGFVIKLGDDDYAISNKIYREAAKVKEATPSDINVVIEVEKSPDELLEKFIADCKIPFRAKGHSGNFYQLNGRTQYAKKALYSVLSEKKYEYEDMVVACGNYYNNTKMSRVTIHNFFYNDVFTGVMEDYLENKQKYASNPTTPGGAFTQPTNKVSL